MKSSNFVFNFEHFFYNKIVFNFIMNFRMIIVHKKKRKLFNEIMFNIVIRKFCYKSIINLLRLFRVDENT